MRLSKYIPLLAAILPLALGQYPAPPNNTCSVGAHRCDNYTLQVCGDNGEWQTVKECSKTAYCFAQETRKGAGDCYPLIRGGDAQCSTVNDHRCDINNSLQECSDHGYWNTVKNCTKTAFCFAQETANGGGDCHPLILNDKQCSTVDTCRCNTNNNLEVCGMHGYWKTAKNCTDTAYCFAQETSSGGSSCYPLVGGLYEQCSTANEVRCDNKKLKKCTPHGYWKVVKDCKESETCSLNSKNIDGGFCVPIHHKDDPLQCKANTHRCNDNKIQDCTTREHWSDRTTCGADQVCMENCTYSGCKPYCLGREQFYISHTDNKNSSIANVASKYTRSELESCDRLGIERCMYDPPIRTQSCTNGTWVDKEICPANTICWADNDGDETAECAAVPEFPPQSSSTKNKRPELEYCDHLGADRCAFEPARIQECSATHTWQDVEICPNEYTCWKDNDTLDGPARTECVELPQPMSK